MLRSKCKSPFAGAVPPGYINTLLDPEFDNIDLEPLRHELRSTGVLEVLPMYRAEYMNEPRDGNTHWVQYREHQHDWPK